MYICNHILLSHKKEGHPAICVDVDGPREHYAQCNKPNAEKQVLSDLPYIWKLKKLNSKRWRIEGWLSGAGE